MGKKNGGNAQRAKKKHAKEVKRRNAPAKRPHVPAGAETAARLRAWRPAEEGIEGLVRRAGSHFYAAAASAAEIAGALGLTLPETVWTLPRIGVLPTEDLLARLSALGVRVDQSTFLADSGPLDSAVRLAEDRFLPLLPTSATPHDRDFARLAACELWKRFCPEIPSAEGRLDLYRRVMERASAEDERGTVVAWLELWTVIRARLTPEIRTVKALDALFGSLVSSFDDWIELLVGAAEVAGSHDPALANRAAAALGEIHAQLADQDAAWKGRLLEDQTALRDLPST